jgi:bacterial/archaeal transporter family-2 protein
MLMKIVFVALAVAAGVAASLQAAINAALSKSTGLGAALVVNTVVVLVGAIGLWAAMGAKMTFFAAGASRTLYLGGLLGFVIIASLTFVFPRIGAAYAVALMVAGQCVAAVMVDHFGFMGMPREPMTIQRMIGLALVTAGAIVVRMV